MVVSLIQFCLRLGLEANNKIGGSQRESLYQCRHMTLYKFSQETAFWPWNLYGNFEHFFCFLKIEKNELLLSIEKKSCFCCGIDHRNIFACFWFIETAFCFILETAYTFEYIFCKMEYSINRCAINCQFFARCSYWPQTPVGKRFLHLHFWKEWISV